MANEVKIEYDQMSSIMTVFEEHGQRAQQMLQKVNAQVDALRSGLWIGPNADQFYREMDNEALVALQRLVQAFQQANETTARISQVMQNAEDEAAAIFRTTP